MTTRLLAFLLGVVFLAAPVTTGCKPTYVDPITKEEIACSEIPAITLEQTIAELGQVYAEQGLNGVYTYAILKGVAHGGCALAYFVQSLLAPAPGEQTVTPEDSLALRGTLEKARTEFLRIEREKAKAGEAPPPQKIIWINAAGQAL